MPAHDTRAPVHPLAAAVTAMLMRDLDGFARQLEAYSSEEAVWRLAPGISNSAGTLALHISGNIQHFVGAVLGGTGYVRDRDAEFARRGVSRAELQRELQAAAMTVEAVLPSLSPERIDAEFPVAIAGKRVRTSDFLTHLVAHLAYHLGQVDSHRRMLDGGAPIDVLAPARLPEFGG